MSSIKQLIVNAIIKVSGENPALNAEGGVTAEEARDDFIRLLLAELFPEDPSVPVPKTKKTKKTKDVPEPAAESAAEPAAELSPGKKKRAPMTDEAKAAMKAKREATIAAKKAGEQSLRLGSEDSVLETSGSNAAASAAPAPEVKEKKTKKTKPVEGANLAKIDPTWRKHLKHADKDHAKEREPELLKYVNALSKEDFDGKKAEEHVADFLASRVPTEEKVEAELTIVDFEGKEYFVNPETKRVYEGEGECDADGNWTNYKGVGYVGMAAFAEMKMEDE
jgi:hypothetical protein